MPGEKIFVSPLLFSIFFFFCLADLSSSSPDSTALLAFKASISVNSNGLSSWTNSTDPCFGSWLGVTCDPTTHRVTKLVLEDLNLTGGSVVPLSGLTELRLLSLKCNRLSSASGHFNVSSWTNLKHLYLSHNGLSGMFPSGVSHIRRLRRLDLSHNQFSGHVPMSELVRLPHLLTLRLESNSFSGTIHSVSSLSSSIVEFNVSHNYLVGKIPAWLSRFPASSFSGNQHLCGSPLPYACSYQTVESKPSRSNVQESKRKRSNWVVVLIVSADMVAIAAALVTISCCCYHRRRRNVGTNVAVAKTQVGSHLPSTGGFYGASGGGPREGELVVFEGCKGFGSVDDLLSSSADLLGRGSAGHTYKVVMNGGDAVVVKRVRDRRKRKETCGSLKMIGGLRHSNIVSLRAYYDSGDELLLVYDFQPNGCLHSLLHGNRGPWRTPLDWTTRLRLASGSAQGLAFLHSHNKAKLFHGNLTSSNILVDHSGNARIADIGLHRLFHSTPSLSNDAYRAPELRPNNNSTNANQREFTQKCDVYSLGVVLLEILTGKMPTGEGETSLVKWVQRVGREEWTWEVFDFELLRCREMEEEMVALMQVALLCVAPLPRDRPKMSTVHGMIEDIRTKGAREGGGSYSIINDLSSDSSPSLSESNNNFGAGDG